MCLYAANERAKDGQPELTPDEHSQLQAAAAMIYQRNDLPAINEWITRKDSFVHREVQAVSSLIEFMDMEGFPLDSI